MARTMQTARKTTGGTAPRQKLASPPAREAPGRTARTATKPPKHRRPARKDESILSVEPVKFRGFDAARLQVWKRVRVQWPTVGGMRGGWYRGVIQAVYPDAKKVSILYDDLDELVCDRLDCEWELDEEQGEDAKSADDEAEWGVEGVGWRRSCVCRGDRDRPLHPLPFSGVWLMCDTCQISFGHAECCHPQLHHLHWQELQEAAEADDFIWICPTCQPGSDDPTLLPPAPVAADQAGTADPMPNLDQAEAAGPVPNLDDNLLLPTAPAATDQAETAGRTSDLPPYLLDGDDAQHPICLE